MSSRDDWRRDPRSFQDNYHRQDRPREEHPRRRYSPQRPRDYDRPEYRDRDRDGGRDRYERRDYRSPNRYPDRDRDYDRSRSRYSRSRSRSPRRQNWNNEEVRDDRGPGRKPSGEDHRPQISGASAQEKQDPDLKNKGESATTESKKADGAKKAKKRKAEVISEQGNTKLQAQFGLWTKASDEVHGVEKAQKEAAAPQKRRRRHSYAHTVRKCCLLCRRQFTDEEKLRKHERKSKLHLENLRDSTKRQAAYRSLIKYGIVPPERAGAQYVDRAKERRQLHQQPNKLRPSNRSGFKAPKALSEAEEEPTPQSKAASMMNKMGWSQGQGLGADNSGSAAPIETMLYAQGVGLGAAGGKVGDAVEEADKSTRGDYNTKGWDKTRERFEAMK